MPDKKIYLAIWVDDIFLFYHKSVTKEAKKLWTQLQDNLDLGTWQDIHDCLGCNVTRDRTRKILKLSQTKAIQALLQKVNMANCSPMDTPVTPGFVFTKEDSPQTEVAKSEFKTESTWYRSVLASLIYFCSWTRPDLAYAQSKLSKFMQNPGPKHVKALKRALRYLKKTTDLGLVYDFSKKPPRSGIYGYYDASYADESS